MERRRSPRYPIRLRTYFPEYDLWGTTKNVSLDGCFIEVERYISEGFLADLQLELPIIGIVFLKGYVLHIGQGEGVGMQFVQVRFSEQQSDYYPLYEKFVKLLPSLEEIRAEYLEMVQQGKLELQTFPKNS